MLCLCPVSAVGKRDREGSNRFTTGYRWLRVRYIVLAMLCCVGEEYCG
jgi:hypothetical protein